MPSDNSTINCARALVVSYQIHTAVVWVKPCGIQSGTGTGFLQVFWFRLPILIPPTAPHLLIMLPSMPYTFDIKVTVK
jgi:hypothetical protein